jgi:hypothetical protein
MSNAAFEDSDASCTGCQSPEGVAVAGATEPPPPRITNAALPPPAAMRMMATTAISAAIRRLEPSNLFRMKIEYFDLMSVLHF